MLNNKVLKKICMAVFLIALSCLLFAYMQAEATKADNLKSVFIPAISYGMTQNITSEQLGIAHAVFLQNCTNNPSQESILIPLEPNPVAVSCSKIIGSTAEQLPNIVAETLFDSMYYKDYGCNFIDCIQTLPATERAMVMLSANANRFYNGIIMPLLILTAASAFGVFMFARDTKDKLKSLGWPLLITGGFAIVMAYMTPDIGAGSGATQQALSIVKPMLSNINAVMMPKYEIITALGVIMVALSYFVKGKSK